jgi:hypothetical protein
LLGVALLGLAACTPNQPYRNIVELCTVERHSANCAKHSLEQTSDYLLGYVEFDDQGVYHSRAQLDGLFDEIEARGRDRHMIMLVFVHGWKHNAKEGDGNIGLLRTVLARTAATERARAAAQRREARPVVGIYAGWRGLSVPGEPLANVSFWTRKAAAHRVAVGSIRELFARAREYQLDKNDGKDGRYAGTRLVYVGHSFGGLVLYDSIAQHLVDEGSVANSRADKSEVGGYGDLVVLINPAFEAIRYDALNQITRNRTRYVKFQRPVLVTITSEADWATDIAFPLGRSLNTAFESFVWGGELSEARTAVGHFKPFTTHRLAMAEPPTQCPPWPQGCPAPSTMPTIEEARSEFCAFQRLRAEGRLPPGWERRYKSGAVLKQDANRNPDAPFWVVSTDRHVMSGHNQIQDPVIRDFLVQLVDDSVRYIEGGSTYMHCD